MAYARGDQLGIAIPIPQSVTDAVKRTVGSILTSARNAIVGIVDPGRKRDANRRARADMWARLADQGSITAARILYGGTYKQYTSEEKGWYRDRWNIFQRSHPDLASEAMRLGGLGVPEPGSGSEPPQLTSAMQAQVEQEIAEFQATGSMEPAPSGGTAVAGLTDNKLVMALAAGGLALALMRRGRR